MRSKNNRKHCPGLLSTKEFLDREVQVDSQVFNQCGGGITQRPCPRLDFRGNGSSRRQQAAGMHVSAAHTVASTGEVNGRRRVAKESPVVRGGVSQNPDPIQKRPHRSQTATAAVAHPARRRGVGIGTPEYGTRWQKVHTSRRWFHEACARLPAYHLDRSRTLGKRQKTPECQPKPSLKRVCVSGHWHWSP